MVIAVAALALIAAGSAAAQPAATVRLLDFRFEPATVTVAPGATVRLVNDGMDHHTYTSADAARPFDAVLAPGASQDLVVPSSNGTIHVYCRFHASPGSPTGTEMAGDLVLAAEAAPGDRARDPAPSRGLPGAPLAALAVAAVAAALMARRGS